MRSWIDVSPRCSSLDPSARGRAVHSVLSPRRSVLSCRAFTLLEILVSVAIFSIVTATVYSVFRTGMRAYEVGIHTGDLMQTGRFAMDIVARDLKSIFLIPETNYNLQYHRRLQVIEQERIRLEQEMGNPEELAKKIEEFNRAGMGLDLSFRASGTADASQISFVRHQNRAGARPLQPMNLARVSYRLADQALLRCEEDVFRPDLDSDGTEMERPVPQPETLLRGVKSFGVRYGFYYDGEWLETDNWNSTQKGFRTDSVQMDSEDPLVQTPLEQLVGAWQSRQADDNLPSYVRVKVVVEDPRGKGLPRAFERTINIPNAQDSHIPMPEEMKVTVEDGEKREERSIRRSEILKQPNATRRSDRLALPGEDERPRTGEAARFYLK